MYLQNKGLVRKKDSGPTSLHPLYAETRSCLKPKYLRRPHGLHQRRQSLKWEGKVFWMNAKPIHKVQLDDFEICRYPVSQQLWYDVMGKNPERLKFENRLRPVESISWDGYSRRFFTHPERKNPRP